MFACYGFGFDFTVVEGGFVEDQFFDVSVVHHQKFHHFAQHSALHAFAYTQFLGPLEVPLDPFDYRYGGAYDFIVVVADFDHGFADLEVVVGFYEILVMGLACVERLV